MVSAWAVESGIVFGQIRVTEKSNEITAIPKLLDAIEIKGNIITIDAMGCQKEIAKIITEKQADFIFSGCFCFSMFFTFFQRFYRFFSS